MGGALSMLAVGIVLAFSGADIMLAIEVDEPRRAVVGEPFTLNVAITNPSPDSVNFSDFDFPDAVLANFTIESFRPAASADSPVGGGGTQTYYFETELAAGATHTVELTLRPRNPGSHRLQLDACNDVYCSTIWRTIDVSPQP